MGEHWGSPPAMGAWPTPQNMPFPMLVSLTNCVIPGQTVPASLRRSA